MKPSSMSNLRRWWQRHLAVPALLGLVALVAALLLASLVSAPLRLQEANLSRQRSQIAAHDSPARSAARPAADQLGALPGRRQRGADLEALVTDVQRSGLVLDKADYAMTEVDASGAARLEATLPVTGTYAELRRFLVVTLERHPHAALEALQLERPDTRSQQLQATAKLVFFYREGAP
jgi:hypothetical protein